MSKFLRDECINRNKIMNKTIKKYSQGGKTYEGTNPVLDEAVLFEEKEKIIADINNQEKIVDPFELYGFGVVAYFKTLRMLLLCFLVICILYIPIFAMYGSRDFFSNFPGNGLFLGVSLGNIG
jgi:hypothetical protein